MPKLTAAQLAERRTGLGSSDIAALLGLSPYEGATAWGVFNEKRGLVLDSGEETPQQRRGHDIEPLLAKWYKDELGAEDPVRLIPGTVTIRHPTESWAFCTVDYRLDGRRRNLELKNVGIGRVRDWDKLSDDGVPDYVRIQCAWQMWIKDDDDSHVGAFLGGTDFRVWLVERDRDLEAMLVEKGRAFWRRIQSDDPPIIDDSEECRAYLKAKYPRPSDVTMRGATEDEEKMARARHAMARQRAASEIERARLDNELIARMKEGTGILGADGWKATYKAGKDKVARYRFTPAKGWGEDGTGET